jgi:hypothetical protein
MGADVLLELLERVVGSWRERVEPSVEVAGGDMAVGEQRGRGDVVGREPVERIRQHLD